MVRKSKEVNRWDGVMQMEWSTSCPRSLRPEDIHVSGFCRVVPFTRRVESYNKQLAEKKSSFSKGKPAGERGELAGFKRGPAQVRCAHLRA
jgi:hypothetical protein